MNFLTTTRLELGVSGLGRVGSGLPPGYYYPWYASYCGGELDK